MARARFPLAVMLKDKRRIGALSVRAAEKQSGVSMATISRVERGNMPDVPTVLALCRWLGVSVEYAITGKQPEGTCSRCVRTDFVLDNIRADLASLTPPAAGPRAEGDAR